MVRLAVAVLLAFASVAEAGTTLVLSDGAPAAHQRWVDGALVPTPDMRVTLVRGACPDAPLAQACAYESPPTIYLAARDRFALLHELGHFYADTLLTPRTRRRARVYLRLRRWDEERFADAYAVCALRRNVSRELREYGVGYRPTPHQHRKVCALLRSYASGTTSTLGS